jgi:hypothetical protein
MLADRMEAISRGGEPASIARRTSDRLDALFIAGLEPGDPVDTEPTGGSRRMYR